MREPAVLDAAVYSRRVLPLDPERPVAIKRGVRAVDVGATAVAMMPAFAATLEDPDRTFGSIRLLRTADKRGRPFEVGERFQGRYVIEKLILPRDSSFVPFRAADRLFDTIEDHVLSDYGVITDIVLEPPPGHPYRLRYEYLEGTPIAGSLAIECADISPGVCRFTEISEYQEGGLAVLVAYGTSVLKMHVRVFYEMVKQSADRIGAPILGTDIPETYYRPR